MPLDNFDTDNPDGEEEEEKEYRVHFLIMASDTVSAVDRTHAFQQSDDIAEELENKAEEVVETAVVDTDRIAEPENEE